MHRGLWLYVFFPCCLGLELIVFCFSGSKRKQHTNLYLGIGIKPETSGNVQRRQRWVHSGLGPESCVSSCVWVIWVQETDQWLWGTLRCMKEGNKTAPSSHQPEKTNQWCHLCVCAGEAQNSCAVNTQPGKTKVLSPDASLARCWMRVKWQEKKMVCFQPHGAVSRVMKRNTRQRFVFGLGSPEKWSSDHSSKTLLWGSRQKSETAHPHN